MSHKLKTIDPKTILNGIDSALIKITSITTEATRRGRANPKLYRFLLARRIRLSQTSRQITGNEAIKYN